MLVRINEPYHKANPLKPKIEVDKERGPSDNASLSNFARSTTAKRHVEVGYKMPIDGTSRQSYSEVLRQNHEAVRYFARRSIGHRS